MERVSPRKKTPGAGPRFIEIHRASLGELVHGPQGKVVQVHQKSLHLLSLVSLLHERVGCPL
jgi:hypothetical protein